MTPEQFDAVYYQLTRSLGAAEDPVLLRDRLILALLQRMTGEAAIEAIKAAELPDGLDVVKTADRQDGVR